MRPNTQRRAPRLTRSLSVSRRAVVLMVGGLCAWSCGGRSDQSAPPAAHAGTSADAGGNAHAGAAASAGINRGGDAGDQGMGGSSSVGGGTASAGAPGAGGTTGGTSTTGGSAANPGAGTNSALGAAAGSGGAGTSGAAGAAGSTGSSGTSGAAGRGARCTLGRCTVSTSCDDRQVTCERAHPTCPPGQTPTVTEDKCWGPCIDVAECPRVPSCDVCGDEHCVQFAQLGGTLIRCVPREPGCELGELCECLSPCGAYACSEQNGELSCFCPGC